MSLQPVEPAADDTAAQLDRVEDKIDAMLDLLAGVSEAFGPRIPITLRAKLAAAHALRRIPR